jgi:hypothetical protein
MSTSTSPVAGKIGQALKFNNVSSAVNMGINNNLSITGALTVSAWVNHRGLTSNDTIAGRSAGGFGVAGQYALMADASATSLKFAVGNGTTELKSVTGSTIKAGSWYHIVGTYNGTDTTAIYVNGVLIQSTFFSSFGALANPGSSSFGISQAQSIAATIDEVRVYRRALSAAEVGSLYMLGK